MSRTNIVKILNESQKWDIYTNYLEDNFKTKKALAKYYGISVRTLGRIISELENIEEPLIVAEYDYTITKNQITVLRSGESRSITKGYPKFTKIKSMMIDNDFSDKVLAEVYELMYLPKFVETFSDGNITVNHEQGKVFYGTFEIKNSLVGRMMEMLENKESVKPLVKFLEKLMLNPKKSIVDELYPFLTHNDIEIDEEGDIIAYRSIREDWTDHYTGTMDNSIGSVVSMPRYMVDDNPERTCSTGIHVASISYAESFGNNKRIVKVKVNPSDVVSVPVDYNGKKMRVCKALILEEI